MKIVCFDDTGTLGGAGMCLVDSLTSMRAARPDWTFEAVLGDDGPLAPPLERLGVACTVLRIPEKIAELGDVGLSDGSAGAGARTRLLLRGPGAALATYAYRGKLRRWLRQARPDLLHTNGMKAHVLGAWAAPPALPVLWQLHGQIGARPFLGRVMRAAWTPRCQVVAVSRFIAEDAAPVLGPRVSFHTIYNAVDLEHFRPGTPEEIEAAAADLDRAAGMAAPPAGTVRIGLVAAFARLKGHDVFLEAAAKVARERAVRFYVVGGPIYRSLGSQFSMDELRARAQALGLSDRVAFTGFWDDPAAAIRAMDVVVLCSVQPESFGRVIVEGMASRKAVIASAHGGSLELFEDGVTALGCTSRDPDSLAAAMTRLIEDADLRRRLGEAGRHHVEQHFDRRRLAEQWAPVYEKVAAGRARV